MSECMVYPLYMKRGKTSGDVTFAERDDTGLHINKKTIAVTNEDYVPKSFLVEFQSGGSGFLYKVFTKSIKIQDQLIIGLILTAGHVVCNPCTFRQDKMIFTVFMNNRKLAALFLTCFMQTFPQPMLSESNGNHFVYPGDLALLCLVCKKSQAKHFKFFEVEVSKLNVCKGESVIVAGFPKIPENPIYCCPSLAGLPESEILKQVNEAFHSFERLVYSNGEILGKTEHLIDINCASTNGMSGGPILCGKKLIGVYVGGPPLPGQYRLFTINQMIINENYLLAVNNLIDLKLEIRDMYSSRKFICTLEILAKKIATIDIELHGEMPTNFIEVKEEVFYQKTMNLVFKKAQDEMEIFFFNFTNQNSKLFQRMGLRPFEKNSSFSKHFDYLSQRREPESAHPLFIELKEITALLAYIEEHLILKKELSRNILQFRTMEHLQGLFQNRIADYLNLAKSSLTREFERICTDAIYEMVINFFYKDSLTFNVGISCEHPAFNSIEEISETLNSMSGEEFQAMDDFVMAWQSKEQRIVN